MCVLSHFRTCDVRAEVRAEGVWSCACGIACAWATFKVRFAIALFYLFPAIKDATFNLFLHTYFQIDGFNEQIRRRSAGYVAGRLLNGYSAVYYVLY